MRHALSLFKRKKEEKEGKKNKKQKNMTGNGCKTITRILKIGVKCCPPEKAGVLPYLPYLLRVSKKLESEMKSWSNLLQIWS